MRVPIVAAAVLGLTPVLAQPVLADPAPTATVSAKLPGHTLKVSPKKAGPGEKITLHHTSTKGLKKVFARYITVPQQAKVTFRGKTYRYSFTKCSSSGGHGESGIKLRGKGLSIEGRVTFDSVGDTGNFTVKGTTSVADHTENKQGRFVITGKCT